MIIAKSVLIAYIESRLNHRVMAAGHAPEPDTFQYIGRTVTRHHSERSIAINETGYIDRVLDQYELTDYRKCSTPMEMGYEANAIQAKAQPSNSKI